MIFTQGLNRIHLFLINSDSCINNHSTVTKLSGFYWHWKQKDCVTLGKNSGLFLVWQSADETEKSFILSLIIPGFQLTSPLTFSQTNSWAILLSHGNSSIHIYSWLAGCSTSQWGKQARLFPTITKPTHLLDIALAKWPGLCAPSAQHLPLSLSEIPYSSRGTHQSDPAGKPLFAFFWGTGV